MGLEHEPDEVTEFELQRFDCARSQMSRKPDRVVFGYGGFYDSRDSFAANRDDLRWDQVPGAQPRGPLQRDQDIAGADSNAELLPCFDTGERDFEAHLRSGSLAARQSTPADPGINEELFQRCPRLRRLRRQQATRHCAIVIMKSLHCGIEDVLEASELRNRFTSRRIQDLVRSSLGNDFA